MLKLPPHSIEAEQAVLSAIMEKNSLVDDLESLLAIERFYRYEHQLIYKRMQAMALIGQPIDAVTLAGVLDQAGELDQVGGHDFLIDLAMNGRGASNARHYAEMIRDRWLARVLINKAQDIVQAGYDCENVQDAINEAQATILDISNDNAGEPKHVDQAMREALDYLEYVSKLDGELIGVSTGFADLDRITSGLGKGDLMIIAGRPSMGKTTLAMNIAEQAALKDKFVIVFSLEMTAQQLMLRSMSAIGSVKFDLVKKAKDDSIWSGVTAAFSKMKQKPYYIDDHSILTSEQLLSRARKLARQVGRQPDLIVLDYIQLLSDKGDNANEKVSKISRNLKLTAKVLECPVIALSQLNRQAENRADARPKMSDLRDSGAIEQDADIIGFVYRDEVYNKDTNQKGVAELLIRKNRNGETGTIYLASQLDMCRFKDLINYNPPPEMNQKSYRSKRDYE
jgi:replicative DNA helicase